MTRSATAMAVAAAGVFTCFLCVFAVRLSPEARTWWDVSLTLEARGDYAVKNSGTTRSGDFSYEAMWAGTMERDGEDFILYHIETRTLVWEIRERTQPAKGSPVLTEKDSAARPVMKLNYILRTGDSLDFDFVVESIPIPLARSVEKFPLLFPCSGEHVRDRSHLLYNDFVSWGSNAIRVPLDALSEAAFEEKFDWEWKRQGWALREGEPVLVSSRHRAEVAIRLVSHEGLRPGDGSDRRRGADAPG